MSLGPFERLEKVARGEWSEVWRGRHVPSKLDVAIKFVTATKARDPTYRRRFRHEVRAVAGLRHAGIVEVLDYGEIHEGGPAGTGPVSPYLVTEWTDEGTVDEFVDEMNWSTLRGLLLQMTAALGHAHARGVVHRDIKPQNVLVVRDERGNRRPKLTDFGLAHIPDRTGLDEEFVEGTCGTYEFMAPEQFEGDWLDYGPWTDLYSLGCTAWWLATGGPVFAERNPLAMAHKHTDAPLPPFEPDFDVPDGFRRWLAGCLEIAPEDRFRSAAAAEHALRSIPDGGEGSDPTVGGTAPESEHVAAERRADRRPERLDGGPRPTRRGGPEPIDARPPRLPEVWDDDPTPRLPMQLVGAGRELYELRELAMVGREEEREELWRDLREIEAERSPKTVLLTGGSGIGKTRLARWLRERAHELGGWAGMHAEHGERAASQSPVAAMVEDYLDLADVDYHRTVEWLASWYRARGVERADEWHAMADVLGAEPTTGAPEVRVTEPEAERALLRRFLALVAAECPLVVHLDDLHWGRETVDFLESAVGSEELADKPILFVGTCRNEVFDEREVEWDRLGELAELDRVRRRGLDSLSETAQRFLVEQLLYLAPTAAREVVHRSKGNPGFAVTLVGDWLERDLLETTERGFELTVEEPELPDDLREVWSRRLERLARRLDSEEFAGLAMAAVLREPFEASEWREACRAAGLSVGDDLLERLIREGVVLEADGGLRLAHQMLGEAIELRAKEDGRWREIHEARVEQLTSSDPADAAELEVLAGHRRETGDLEGAVESLLQAVDRRGSAGELDAAEWSLERAETMLAELDRPSDHPHEITRQLRRARVELAQYGDVESAERQFREALERAEAGGHRRLAIRASLGVGRILERTMRRDDAEEHFRRAKERVELECEPELGGRVHRNVGRFLTYAGRPDRGSTVLTEALEASGLPCLTRAKLQTLFVSNRWFAGAFDEADAAVREARTLLDRSGYRALKPMLLAIEAELAVDRGEMERAGDATDRLERLASLDNLDAYEGTVRLLRAKRALTLGSDEAADYQLSKLGGQLMPVQKYTSVSFRLYLAVVRGSWEEARARLEQLVELTDRFSRLTDPNGAAFVERSAAEARDVAGAESLVEELRGQTETMWSRIEPAARRRYRSRAEILADGGRELELRPSDA